MHSIGEIGSEFWDVPVCGNRNDIFPNNVTWYQSGRQALAVILSEILRSRKVTRALLPSWCCESMIKPFIDIGATIEFYGVAADSNSFTVSHPQTNNADVVLIMSYFGFSYNECIPKYNAVIIRDVTHSVFSEKYDDADYYFGSLRKWAGFYTGGFAWARSKELPCAKRNNKSYVKLRKEAMKIKRDFIDGSINDKSYLGVFCEAESLLDKCQVVYSADEEDIERARHFDVIAIKKKRRDNARALLFRLSRFTPFSLSSRDCPLFVPIFISNRDEVKMALIERSIYCPCHWSISGSHALSDKDKFIYKHELSLVCDHRYGVREMNKICDIAESLAKVC